ncbi:uncharacterized protein AMSG_04335 [Thecamonas trahens ATCC 50062]|uniref:Swi5-dependent recombination DNA repair protein 1 homolog n=1 Tax=Thecamonas trahens ATCC 50062 TaxID=461836 RepID=A0A0L0D7S2_THETB|nr:hypothetical protein AMSG_04335 [Thecamonas trahens ATCC 50062]KNC48106.1 hypothetical protein AMSG_04335 [Thecamonas trahens ATCC 50062]|eukprot:XP_013758680.1 hypothetical protein AMSG_04335 [Thecamonas trahens ATCC 50062]
MARSGVEHGAERLAVEELAVGEPFTVATLATGAGCSEEDAAAAAAAWLAAGTVRKAVWPTEGDRGETGTIEVWWRTAEATGPVLGGGLASPARSGGGGQGGRVGKAKSPSSPQSATTTLRRRRMRLLRPGGAGRGRGRRQATKRGKGLNGKRIGRGSGGPRPMSDVMLVREARKKVQAASKALSRVRVLGSIQDSGEIERLEALFMKWKEVAVEALESLVSRSRAAGDATSKLSMEQVLAGLGIPASLIAWDADAEEFV